MAIAMPPPMENPTGTTCESAGMTAIASRASRRQSAIARQLRLWYRSSAATTPGASRSRRRRSHVIEALQRGSDGRATLPPSPRTISSPVLLRSGLESLSTPPDASASSVVMSVRIAQPLPCAPAVTHSGGSRAAAPRIGQPTPYAPRRNEHASRPHSRLDARAVLRPRVRLHDHAADLRARSAADPARPRPGCAHARRDLVDVRRLCVAHECGAGRPPEPAALAARRDGELPRARTRHLAPVSYTHLRA